MITIGFIYIIEIKQSAINYSQRHFSCFFYILTGISLTCKYSICMILFPGSFKQGNSGFIKHGYFFGDTSCFLFVFGR